ncbi:zinc-ribbon domain-containing protein, partial [Thiocystis violacea]|uniref:zinc-ribbon domain-containing protein n=1 Tax=Thiocystis violacea TaxID=13725 RepID=UPI0019076F52|nr:hypothetical protein [Thiocystis violacea]
MFCTQCGAKSPNEARFCQACGHPLTDSPGVRSPPPPPPALQTGYQPLAPPT